MTEFMRPTVTTEEVNDTVARYIVEPLERGYGHTLGNSLRRVLLSSLDGAKATAIQIEGVQIGITLTEKPDGTVRVSVRTTKEMDASAICQKVGGGGHVRAAGASFTCGMNEAKAEMLRVAEEQFHAAK